MAQAISTAKVQSVREIKKKAKIKKMNKRITRIVIAIISLLIIAFLAFSFFLKSDYEFRTKEGGILFYSNVYPPRDAIHILANDENLNVVFNVKTDDINNLNEVTESIAMMRSVFSYYQKSIIFTMNTIDIERRIIECTSNLGDDKDAVQLTKEDCDNLMDTNSSLFIFEFPSSLDYNVSKVHINPESKYLIVTPNSKQELNNSVYLIMKSIYSDLDQTMANIDAFKRNMNSNN